MTGAAPGRKVRRRLSWAGLALVIVIALAFGSGAGRSRTVDDQVNSIARTIKCPQCSGQSAATSEASSAVAIRRDIARRLGDGQSADDIRDYYGTRYEDLLLTPSRSGAASLVWILPVVMVVVTFGALTLALMRNRRRPGGTATSEDRILVSAARSDAMPQTISDDEPLDRHGEGAGR